MTPSAHLVQLLHHLGLGFLVFAAHGKPLVKALCRRKHLWQQKVEQRPQLMEVVLQGRA